MHTPKSKDRTPGDTQKRKRTPDNSDVREYELPFGWIKRGERRNGAHGGATVGKWDIYVFSPSGKKFRSNPEIQKFLKENPKIKYDPEVTNTKRPPELGNNSPRDPAPKVKKIKLGM